MTRATPSKWAEWRAGRLLGLQLPKQPGLVTSRLFLQVRKSNFYLILGFSIVCNQIQHGYHRCRREDGSMAGGRGALVRGVVKEHLLYTPCIKSLFCSSHTNLFWVFQLIKLFSAIRPFVPWCRTLSPPLFTPPNPPYLSSVISSSRRLPLMPQIKSDD